MNEPQRLSHATVEEVASLLIPVAGRQLLVPTVTVAEMVPYREPQRHIDAPDWYLGDIEWRDQLIPVICYEVMCGEAQPSYSSACRIAVLNGTGISDDLPFIAIATQGIPKLARVKAEEIHEDEDAELKRFDMMGVVHAGEKHVIPNVTALEQAFYDYRRTQV
ncbi:hypothetical protein NBRC116494_01980 [Aurantivibrio plasticivorans]